MVSQFKQKYPDYPWGPWGFMRSFEVIWAWILANVSGFQSRVRTYWKPFAMFWTANTCKLSKLSLKHWIHACNRMYSCLSLGSGNINDQINKLQILLIEQANYICNTVWGFAWLKWFTFLFRFNINSMWATWINSKKNKGLRRGTLRKTVELRYDKINSVSI